MQTVNRIGITERGDAGLDFGWENYDCPKILITKAPHRLLAHMREKGTDNYNNCIIHATITGFGGTIIEPGVAKPDVTITAYNELCDIYGGERVVLRVDPIILTEKGKATANNIIAHRRGRVRISFIDMYQHVISRFIANNIPVPYTTMHAPLDERLAFANAINDVEICGEPGMKCTGCVSPRDIAAIGLQLDNNGKSHQRQACECCAAKFEMLTHRGQCAHRCIYCYWK